MTAPPGPPPTHVAVPSRLRQVKAVVPAPVKEAARQAARTWGRRTASSRPLPDFLVVGTKRGGTTSLWNYLLDHPDVLPPWPASQQIKSPHYFDLHHDRGQDWYRSHFATARARRRAARPGGVPVVTGEASPYYLFHPLVPGRVAAELPGVKVLVTLRNPVDRAYSHYNERRGSGAETLATFEEALDAEEARLAGQEEVVLRGGYSPHHDHHTYLARGRYAEQLERWFAAVPREDVLVLLNEDLAQHPERVLCEVSAFLGVGPPPGGPYLRHNLLPARSLAPATRERLVEHYRPHNAALSRLLDLPLGPDVGWDR